MRPSPILIPLPPKDFQLLLVDDISRARQLWNKKANDANGLFTDIDSYLTSQLHLPWSEGIPSR